MVDFVASAIYYARHIIGLPFSIPIVPNNVSLHFRKGDSENLIAYMGTLKKKPFLFPEAVIVYTSIFEIHRTIC